jgi:hypothetical protein
MNRGIWAKRSSPHSKEAEACELEGRDDRGKNLRNVNPAKFLVFSKQNYKVTMSELKTMTRIFEMTL